MTVVVPDSDAFERMLNDYVVKRIGDIAEEEASLAVKRVNERIKAEVDSMALTILKQYDVEWHRDRLVITVRKSI